MVQVDLEEIGSLGILGLLVWLGFLQKSHSLRVYIQSFRWVSFARALVLPVVIRLVTMGTLTVILRLSINTRGRVSCRLGSQTPTMHGNQMRSLKWVWKLASSKIGFCFRRVSIGTIHLTS